MDFTEYLANVKIAGEQGYIPGDMSDSKLVLNYLMLRAEEVCAASGRVWADAKMPPDFKDADGNAVTAEDYEAMIEIVRASWVTDVLFDDEDDRVTGVIDVVMDRAKKLCELDGGHWPTEDQLTNASSDEDRADMETIWNVWMYRVLRRDADHNINYGMASGL